MRAVLAGAMLFAISGQAWAQTTVPTGPAPLPPTSHPAAREPSGSGAQTAGPMTNAEIRDLLDSARATAKSTREGVEYGRVVPDLLTQILVKLDKLEDKLDKVENAVKSAKPRR